MRIRTIAAAFVVAAPLFALGSPQAAACWETGYRYGYSSPTYYRAVALASAGLATGPWVGAVATDTEASALAVLVLAVGG